MAVDFEEEVRAALDSVPPELARGLENVAVVVEEECDPEDLEAISRSGRSGFEVGSKLL